MARYRFFSLRWTTTTNRRFYSSARAYESIPTPRGFPLLGTLWDITCAGGVSQIHNYIDERHRQLGPIFREKLGHVEAVWLADPALYQLVYQNEGTCPRPMLPEPWIIFNQKHSYKRGLFFMQGEEWSHYRKILSPLLLKMATLRRHLESLNDVADILLNRWKCAENGVISNVERDLYCYFVQGLMCLAFGRTIGLDRDIIETYVPGMVSHLQVLFESSARLTLLPPSLAAKFRLSAWKSFEKSALDALGKANQLTITCLDRLEKQDKSDDENNGCIVSSLHKHKVARPDIQRIIADLFLAAADTTSHTTQWVLYLMAQHPEVQMRAVKEIMEAKSFSSQGKTDEWQQIPTIKGCVKEALRLYPVATFLTRILPEPCIIGNYEIPAETLVLMSIFTSGRDERYFQNAQQFLPERWNRSLQAHDQSLMVKEPFASLPFGHGRRACVGRRLAEAQMYIFLQKILPCFVLQTENHVKMIMRLLGTVDQPLRLRLLPRPEL